MCVFKKLFCVQRDCDQLRLVEKARDRLFAVSEAARDDHVVAAAVIESGVVRRQKAVARAEKPAEAGQADDAAVRQARLSLTDATRRVIAIGLGLIGIAAPERM